MKLKLILPEDISEITLSQYQRFVKLTEREDLTTFDFDKRKVSIFANIKFHDLDKVTQKDFNSINKQIDKALNQDCKFVNIFTLNGQEFGFIPNLNEITTAEFVDLSNYGTEIETLHNLMAILFRPITKKDKMGNYDIETYKGTDNYKNIMLDAPMHVVNGALVFFWNLQKQLLASSQRYTLQALKKDSRHRAFSKNGGGTLQSLN